MEEEFRKLESEDNWVSQLESLNTKSRAHSAEIGELDSNQILNRYSNVTPYDRTRIKLSRVNDNDYINANLITVPKAARQYILTQGPLPETVSHFWLMVWEQKSNVIVMLNKCVEVEMVVKCEQYWPNSVNEKAEFPDVQLEVTLKRVSEEKHFTKRELLLKDNQSQKTRTILQFQYKAWPDYDQPVSPTSFLRLLTAVRKSGGLDKMDEPTIVHCSAGIGRSGTFCLIDSILSIVENQGSSEGIDIFNTLIEMRDYRKGLIQTSVQLRFAYMSIINAIKILEKANKLHPHITSINNSADKLSQQKVNGSTAVANGKKQRRNNKQKKQGANNSPSLNVFNKHHLVDAMDDIDSDTADNLFEDATKHLPNLKKARNSAPENFNENLMRQMEQTINEIASSQSNSEGSTIDRIPAATKAQMLTNAMNSLLTENAISKQTDSSQNSHTTNSVLLRRREREMKLAETTMNIKNKMKVEELKRETRAHRMAFLKRSALVGGVAIVLSSIAYMYIHGNTSN